MYSQHKQDNNNNINIYSIRYTPAKKICNIVVGGACKLNEIKKYYLSTCKVQQ